MKPKASIKKLASFLSEPFQDSRLGLKHSIHAQFQFFGDSRCGQRHRRRTGGTRPTSIALKSG